MHLQIKPALASRKLIRSIFLTVVNLGVSVSAYASTCLEQAEKPLEKTFCNIRAAGGLQNLGSLTEFKNNPANIQRLLIKREAKKFGIALPPKESSPAQARSNRQTATPPLTPKVQASLKHCSLIQATINCGASQYALVVNKKNNQLKSKAFSQHNTLSLPTKQDTPFKQESDYRYLSHIYPIYIYKMLELGLGDSTMSFTKFAAVYWQNKMEELDFVERFETVYNKLKLEKSRNQIRSRYQNNYPNNIHQCMRLDNKIIVCDDMKQNWVYQRR